MRLILVRHGQTPANVRGQLDTAPPGAGLTALGQRQAEALPDALRDERVAAVYASPLTRTGLTARPLASALRLEVQVRDGLQEISAGDLEMRSDDEAVAAYAGTNAAWIRGDLARSVPGGSDGHSFLRRYDAAVAAIADEHHDGDAVVVVSHGAAIRVYAGTRATGLDREEAVRVRISNTGAAVLDGDPVTGWRLARWSGGPLGGPHLLDTGAHDVTGESAAENAPGDVPAGGDTGR